MNFKKISVVISKEYLTRVKKKSFLVTTFLVPVLFAAMCCIPALIMLFNKDEVKSIALVDDSGIVASSIKSDSAVHFIDCTANGLDSLKAGFDNVEYAAILHVSPLDSTNNVSVCTYSKKPLGMSVVENMESKVEDIVRDYRISLYNIAGLKDIMEEVRPDITVKSYTLDENGEDKVADSHVYMMISFGLGIIIFIFVSMFSATVMSSVIEEKQSKVVEVLLSSVDAVSLMFGKVIGVALVALTQFILWIVLTAVLVSAVFGIVGKEAISGVDARTLVEQASGAAAIPGVDLQSAAAADLQSAGTGADLLSADTADLQTAGVDLQSSSADAQNAMAQAVVENEALRDMLQTISGLNIPLLLGSFFIFFIFGYLLYASMFAAIGSAVDNVDDSNQLQIPLTVPLMLGYFIAIMSWNAPDSAIAVWGSMIPFTSPIVMLSRIPFGVPAWQLALSIALLVATFVVMAWLSAKIYRVGILPSGKKAGFKDLWKWLKQK